MDLESKAVRIGWMLFFPQFKESSLEVARETEAAGATDAKAVATHVAGRLKSKDLELAVGDPDDPENWLRIWLIWRGNAIMASAKGQEFFLRHYSAPTTTASPRRTRRTRSRENSQHERPTCTGATRAAGSRAARQPKPSARPSASRSCRRWWRPRPSPKERR